MKKHFYIYILASKKYGTLYTGVTSDLVKRISEHKQGLADGFTKCYEVKTLVYFELVDSAEIAFKREKNIKAWKRWWKIRLIDESNPEWRDLYEEIII